VLKLEQVKKNGQRETARKPFLINGFILPAYPFVTLPEGFKSLGKVSYD